MLTLFTAESMPHLRAVLEQYGAALLAAYRDNLLPRTAGGDLITTATARVETDGAAWDVIFSLKEYWKYIEDGTRPHWPPAGALLPWIRVKPVIPRPDERTGRLPTEKQLDFLIRRKISKKGTQGSHDLERAEHDVLPRWQQKIGKALLQDATEWTTAYVTETFRELNPAPVEI